MQDEANQGARVHINEPQVRPLSPKVEASLIFLGTSRQVALVDAEYNDSDSSTTSTIRYDGQKPFRSIAPLIASLIQQHFKPHCAVEVEHMKGGGYNRVTGVKLSNGVRLVVRCPRFNYEKVCHDIPDHVATLRYVQSLKSIKVPNTLYYDMGSDNVIGWPYVIQDRVDGRTLQWWLCHLKGDDLMKISEAVVEVTSLICRTTFPSAGVIRAKAPPAVDEIRLTLPGPPEKAQTPEHPYRDTLSFLHESLDSHMEPGDLWTNSYIKRLKEFATRLNQDRPFSNRFALWHSDYEPRNLLARRLESGTFVIEAVLDFDDAVAAPIEVAWTLPHWLWTWDPKIRDSDVSLADVDPGQDQLRRVKNYVEERMENHIAGFMEVWRSGKAVRQLFYFAMHGFSHGQHVFKRADQLIGPPPEDWWRSSDSSSDGESSDGSEASNSDVEPDVEP